MESAVLESIYAGRILEYRDKEIAPASSLSLSKTMDTFESNIPSLQFLWSFRSELLRDRPVVSLSWNKEDGDILAAGYGSVRVSAQSPPLTDPAVPGIICCWSLKNPEFPARIFKCSSPVTSLDFSRASANLLAVGFMDGRIAVYDVRYENGSEAGGPCVDSASMSGKHRDPVWQVKWVDREQSIGDTQARAEAIVSISTDGRVCQWHLRKGLECIDLMTLKMVKSQDSKAGKMNSSKNSFISRSAGGLSFDFNPADCNSYVSPISSVSFLPST
jgi:WD40 repeat protein